MTGVKIELLIEFAVILLAPMIHTYYLWKYKKVGRQELVRNLKLFIPFYLLFGIGVILLIMNR
jgi:uncharacterized membrane protein